MIIDSLTGVFTLVAVALAVIVIVVSATFD